jgi:glycosyltransferase involved in cell wall biosynthesis
MPSANLSDKHPGAAFAPHVLMTADAVGGVWQYALDLSSRLIARGGRVTLAVMGPPPSSIQYAVAREAGLHVEIAPFRLEWMEAPWDDVDAAGEWLLALERALEPDVVHVNGLCHGSLAWRAPAIAVAHSCVCSWWRAVHGEPAPAEWREYRARVVRGLRAVDMVVAPTAAMRRALQCEYGAPGAAARVIANGRSIVAATDTPIPDKAPYILAAGRLWDPAKNIQALCGVAPSLTWPVFVAGDTHGPTDCSASLAHVRWLGSLDRDMLQGWMAGAAIYALPARYEPFGLSVLEAAAEGCALVLGDIDSLRETWDDAAVFVPPANPDALAIALQELIVSSEERQRLGTRARERASGFTVERMTDAYMCAYAEVAGLRSRRCS